MKAMVGVVVGAMVSAVEGEEVVTVGEADAAVGDEVRVTPTTAHTHTCKG